MIIAIAKSTLFTRVYGPFDSLEHAQKVAQEMRKLRWDVHITTLNDPRRFWRFNNLVTQSYEKLKEAYSILRKV